MKRGHFVSAVVVLAVAIAAACSGGKEGSSSGSGGDGNQGGSGHGGSGMGGGFDTVSVGPGGSCQNSCSADLKNVIGCNGEVLETCTGDQACLGGACTDDPCGAAEASKSSYGCDYWAVKPDLITEGLGACFAAYVANTWSVPVHIDVFRQGTPLGTSFIYIPQGQGQSITYQPYDAAQGLPVGEVALVFLSHQTPPPAFVPACPMPAAVNAESGVLGTGRGQAFNIRTDRPVVAYSILPYGGGPSAATSATLLLPTSAWDTNYVAVNAYQKSQAVAQAQPSLNILAYKDGTDVTILPKVQLVGGPGVTGSPPNTPITYTLNAGEYVQISQDQELTGSPIQSTEPVGLWGAASCLNVPPSAYACDSAHQQIPPVKALGSEYIGVRYRNRMSASTEEAPPWRIVGAVDGTQLTWVPAAPPGAPMALNLGDVFEFMHSGPWVVKSQDADHPFYLAQYMTGADYVANNFSGEGDPEWVNVIPQAQYLDSYVFFTDPTYSETSLVVIRKKGQATMAFADVTLDCAGVLGGWQPVGDYEYTRIDLVTGNFQDVGGCSNGRHEMSSTAPFGLVVWGWGGYAQQTFTQYVSYAYPAGASVQPINEVIIPPTPR
jgi:IgGFc binding protein